MEEKKRMEQKTRCNVGNTGTNKCGNSDNDNSAYGDEL